MTRILVCLKLQNLSNSVIYLTVNWVNLNQSTFWRNFTNSFRIVITWKIRNIRCLFPLRNKNDYKSFVYKKDCSCCSRYIEGTKHNAEVRWNKHNNPTKSSEPSKHLRSNTNYRQEPTFLLKFPWNASNKIIVSRNLDGFSFPVTHHITGHTDFPWKLLLKALMWRHIMQKIP